MPTNEFSNFLKDRALHYFMKYVKVNTRSDPDSNTSPSSRAQLDLGRILMEDLIKIGLADVVLDEFGYVYATLPASPGVSANSLSLIAHMDTSPSESGENVKPNIHANYQGDIIVYPDDPNLKLTPSDSPELTKFIGQDIITASGKTLLGADDKAGIAAILAACELFILHPELPHPELRLAFTPDEETGRGTDHIDLSKLAPVAYTIDGGELGELESECFDAWSAKLYFRGRNVHPGSAKNVMINAGAVAARFLAALPEAETPEHTEKREGFFHLTDIAGDENSASLQFILRDFEESGNQHRIKLLEGLVAAFLIRYPNLEIRLETAHSYQNMHLILQQYPEVAEKAALAMQAAGIEVLRNAIRGGTDGARLCFMGIPTPNIFSGGLMYHSRQEWIPVIALQKASEVIIQLAALYA